MKKGGLSRSLESVPEAVSQPLLPQGGCPGSVLDPVVALPGSSSLQQDSPEGQGDPTLQDQELAPPHPRCYPTRVVTSMPGVQRHFPRAAGTSGRRREHFKLALGGAVCIKTKKRRSSWSNPRTCQSKGPCFGIRQR